jgi:hypothetical protein
METKQSGPALFMGRTSHDQAQDGMLPSFCSYWNSSSPSYQHCRSKLPLTSVLSTTDLIARCAITLQKWHNQISKLKSQVYAARIQAAITFEQQHKNTINNYKSLVIWY